MSGISRRSAVGLLGASGVAAATLVTTRPSGTASGHTASPGAAGPDEAYASALREGAPFGRWSIARVHPVERGAIRVDVRERSGAEFSLEILARDGGGSRPPAEVGELAIYVCNGGDGWSPTAEEHGLAAMALGALLEKNGETARMEGLLTRTDRFARHKASLVPAV